MSSIIEGYNYDIFISYRQKDNKGDRWVSEFVEALKTELESTFKEEISVYFDINPLDGLLETHDVDESLKEKLKCLVFIPIISRTYCDPKSFAWEHEFKAFVELASKDTFGLKAKLSNGNVASRVLPIRIHDLDKEDIRLFDSVLGGVLRSVDFIYKSAGVNRPLRANEDNPQDNTNKTYYRNQINKVANSMNEIISGLKNKPLEFEDEPKEVIATVEKPALQEKSIIVLPFENISPDPDQEYFSDGLTEEIIADLSHIHNLLVISRSSAMTFKGTKKKISEIVREVNVHYALEGSVRKSGNNLRITAQLIDGINDSHIWAEKYSGTLDDVFHIQEKVSRSIAGALMLKLSPEETENLTKHKVKNLQAYECYLRAKQDLWKYTEDSLTRAEQNLENGLKILGEHELLYTGLGQIYFQLYDSGIRMEEECLSKLEDYIGKIFTLNPDSEHAFRLSGLLKLKRENALTAFRDFQRALELNPTDPDTLLWVIYILCFHIGQPEKAVPLLKKIMEIDPLTPANQSCPAIYYWMKGDFKTAMIHMDYWFDMEPDSNISVWYKGILMVLNRDYDQAFQFIDRINYEKPGNFFVNLLLLYKYCLQKNREAARPLFTDELKKVGWNDFGLPWFIAGYYSMIEEKDESQRWLERAVEMGLVNYPLLSKIDPNLENIRGEERFKRLMERVKYEWENFEV